MAVSGLFYIGSAMAPSMPPSRVLRLLCLEALGRLATAQREKWCCKYKMLPVKGGGVVDPESGQLEQCEDGVMFIGGNVIRGREAPPLDDPHVRGLILTTVLTNGAYALPFKKLQLPEPQAGGVPAGWPSRLSARSSARRPSSTESSPTSRLA